MKRRAFLVSSAMLAMATRRPMAQQPARMKRVASMHPTTKVEDQRIESSDPTFTFLLEEMRLGYVEGVNFVLERYSAEGQYDRNPEIAHKIVATRPDVILSNSNPVTSALLSETRTIPIVAWTGDPIFAGFVTKLARPGGNITGISLTVDWAGIVGKRLQLLAEAVGKLSNVRGLTVFGPDAKAKIIMEAAAEKLKIATFRTQQLQSPVDETEYRRAFEAMRRDHVDGALISADNENYAHRVPLGQLAREYRLPAICWFSDSVEAGALMAYAHDVKAEARRLGAQIVEILNGGNPAEMPIFQETHWELVINLKAAKELGLEIPPGLVAQADRVID
jgi:putative ABC transport system substrate-binding protein